MLKMKISYYAFFSLFLSMEGVRRKKVFIYGNKMEVLSNKKVSLHTENGSVAQLDRATAF